LDLTSLALHEFARLLARRELSPVELTSACLERVSSLDGRLGSFIKVTAEQALDDARAAGGIRPKGPLHGSPIALKDLYDVRGVPTTAGSSFLRDHIATAERSVVRVLLGGKALVTVRELSALTITEDTGRSIVDMTAGKIAMGVLRQRMRPGEVIEIRTPNAIAAIRGTVLVVELIPEPGGTPGAPRYTTKVHVLHGLVEVSDPKNPGAPPEGLEAKDPKKDSQMNGKQEDKKKKKKKK